jgi:Asp-tRNA(Asn)/Glu-tRNA(Gln) amidotransferase A subunit family amidase
MGEAGKRFGLSRALEVWQERRGWSLFSSSASARPSIVQQEKQPQQSQQHQLIEKQVWNHGKTSSLGGETGGFYLIRGPIELSAAWRYTTRCLDTVDVAITASSMDPACAVEDAERCEYTYHRQARAPFNLTGSPALAVPTGFASTGLPLSMQIIGKPFDEATVYRVARAYEQATPWTQMHPVLA